MVVGRASGRSGNGRKCKEGSKGRRRKQQHRTRWLDSIINSMDMGRGDNEGQGSLACYSPWGRKESDTTERLSDKGRYSTTRTSSPWHRMVGG